MHCRETLFTTRCSPRAREFPRSMVNFFVRRTVAELRGVKIAQFSDFGLFSHTKRLKSTFRWPAYSPGVISQNDYDFSTCSRRSKGVCRDVFLWLLVGELGTPNLPKFSPMLWSCLKHHIWKLCITVKDCSDVTYQAHYWNSVFKNLLLLCDIMYFCYT